MPKTSQFCCCSKKHEKKRSVVCECSIPQCKSCFVLKPKESQSKTTAFQKTVEDANHKGCQSQSHENEIPGLCNKNLQSCQDQLNAPQSYNVYSQKFSEPSAKLLKNTIPDEQNCPIPYNANGHKLPEPDTK